MSVHNDRYRIDGQYRQIMLSARELNSESLPNRNWINERLTFTHGYGVTLGPVNQVTPEGLPVLFIKDLPPQSTVDLKIDEPTIYYGQLSNDHVFVKTRAREFHYPRGDDNVYTSYEGTGGVPMSSLFRRVLFSIRFRSFKALLSDDITSESRVMFYRRLSERVARIAPFLRYDADPYLVISERPPGLGAGRLHGQSGRYPYSTPAVERHQLHPQLGEGDGRRLPRHGSLLPDRRRRSDRADAPQRVPGPVPCRSPRCPRTCGRACAIPKASSRCRRRCTRPTT